MKLKFGTSPLSGKIYYGTTKIDKNGMELWVKKTEATEEIIKAVVGLMYYQAEKTGACQIESKGFGKMTFVREKKDGD